MDLLRFSRIVSMNRPSSFISSFPVKVILVPKSPLLNKIVAWESFAMRREMLLTMSNDTTKTPAMRSNAIAEDMMSEVSVIRDNSFSISTICSSMIAMLDVHD